MRRWLSRPDSGVRSDCPLHLQHRHEGYSGDGVQSTGLLSPRRLMRLSDMYTVISMLPITILSRSQSGSPNCYSACPRPTVCPGSGPRSETQRRQVLAQIDVVVTCDGLSL